MSDRYYPRGKRNVRFFKQPGGPPGRRGFYAEPVTALPHVFIPHDGAIVEVSTELAHDLVEKGLAEMSDVSDALVEAKPNAEAVVPKAESKPSLRDRLGLSGFDEDEDED